MPVDGSLFKTQLLDFVKTGLDKFVNGYVIHSYIN